MGAIQHGERDLNIVFCGDFHLDKNHKGPGHNRESRRVLDAVNSMTDIANYCEDNSVELLVFTGDMYEGHAPNLKRRKYVYQWLHKLKSINVEVLLLLGNHDIAGHVEAGHSLSDLAHLGLEGVRVIEKPELLHYDDFDLALIPWDYDNIIPEFDITRNTLCAAHCSTFVGEPLWADTHLDFQISKEYFYQFTHTFLGHIHMNHIIQGEPFIAYPGSLQQSSWGNKSDMGFYHMTDTNLVHVKYNLRPRQKLTELPSQVDSETIYKFAYWDDSYTYTEIVNAFKGSFSLDIDHERTQTTRSTRFQGNMQDMSEDEIMKQYCESEGIDYGDIERLWLDILNQE